MMSSPPRSQRTRLRLSQPQPNWRNSSRVSSLGGLFTLHRTGDFTTASELNIFIFELNSGYGVALLWMEQFQYAEGTP
jgi:hypothetical protein